MVSHKLNPLCINGAGYIFKIIKLSRLFPERILNIIDMIIQQTAFFARLENVLLSMRTNEDSIVNVFVVKYIFEARKYKLNNVCAFKIPYKLKFQTPVNNLSGSSRLWWSNPNHL